MHNTALWLRTAKTKSPAPFPLSASFFLLPAPPSLLIIPIFQRNSQVEKILEFFLIIYCLLPSSFVNLMRK